jgi:tetratricopeptide (TPR) repeat protein
MSKKKNKGNKKVNNKGNGSNGKKKVDEFDFEKDKLDFKPFLEGKNKPFLNKIFESSVSLQKVVNSLILAQESSLLKILKNYNLKKYYDTIHTPENLRSIFSLCVYKKNTNFIKDLLNDSLFDLNKTDENGNTILHYAAGYEVEALVSLILEQKNSQLLTNNFGKTAVHYASLFNSNPTILKNIIAKFDIETVNQIDVTGRNFEHYLASRGVDCYNKFLKKIFESDFVQKKVVWHTKSLIKSERDKYLKTQKWFQKLDKISQKDMLESSVHDETPKSSDEIVKLMLVSQSASVYSKGKDLPTFVLENKTSSMEIFRNISLDAMREIINPRLTEKSLIKFVEKLSENATKQIFRKDSHKDEVTKYYLYQSLENIFSLYQVISNKSLMSKFIDLIDKMVSKDCSSNDIMKIADIYNEQAVYYINNYDLQFANIFAKKALELIKNFDKIVDKSQTFYANLLECIYYNIYKSNTETDLKGSIEALKKILEINPDNLVTNYYLFEQSMSEFNLVEAEKYAYKLKDYSIYKYLKLLTDYFKGEKLKFDDLGSLSEIEKELKVFSEQTTGNDLLYSMVVSIYRREGKINLKDELNEYEKQLKYLKKNSFVSKTVEDHVAIGLSILVENKLLDDANKFIKKHEEGYKNLDKNISWILGKCSYLFEKQDVKEFIKLITLKKDYLGENFFKVLVTQYISSSFNKGNWEVCKKLYSLLTEKEIEDLPEEHKVTQELITNKSFSEELFKPIVQVQKKISETSESKEIKITKNDCLILDYLSPKQIHKFHTDRKKIELDKKYEFKIKYQNSWVVERWNDDCSKKIKQLVKYDDKDIYFANTGLYFTFDKKILKTLEKENKLDSFLQAAEKGVATSFYGQNGFKFIKANKYEFYELKANSKTRVISNKIFENPLCNKLVILNKIVDNHDNLSKVFKCLKSSIEYVSNLSSFSEEKFIDLIGDNIEDI